MFGLIREDNRVNARTTGHCGQVFSIISRTQKREGALLIETAIVPGCKVQLEALSKVTGQYPIYRGHVRHTGAAERLLDSRGRWVLGSLCPARAMRLEL